ncbi:MAG: flippase-like domain-containing protein [Acidobacteria bacterium]|nr:flippase-like domain-containing protein [Acidobacteriota bacterium]MBI3656058.1 flippase-like domain-containing protein [Acidobacteriota bacterium]
MPWGRWLKIGITGLILWLLLAKVKWPVLVGTLHRADWRWLPLVLALSLAMLFLRAYKWYALLKQSLREVSFREAWVSFLGGTSLGVLTPARLGELGRLFFLKNHNKARAGEAMIVDRMFDLSVLLIFGALGALAVHRRLLAIIVGALTLILLFVIMHPQQLRRLFNGVARVPVVQRWVPQVDISYQNIGLPMFAWQLLITTINCLLDLVSFYFLLTAFEAVSVAPVLYAFPLILLSNLIPLTIGGLGIREGTAMLLLSRHGVSPAAAIDASFLLYFLNTLVPGLAGALWLLKRNLFPTLRS